MKQTHRTY